MPEAAELCADCSTREEAAASTEAQRLARVSRLLGSALAGARTGDVHMGDVHTGDVHTGDVHTGDVHTGDVHTGDVHTIGALEGDPGGVPGETSLAVKTLWVIETLVPVGRMDREVLLRLCALGFVELPSCATSRAPASSAPARTCRLLRAVWASASRWPSPPGEEKRRGPYAAPPPPHENDHRASRKG